MSDLGVDPAELRMLASSLSALSGDLVVLCQLPSIDGGGGTPDVDAAVGEFGAFTGSRMRHLASDLADLSKRLSQSADVYDQVDSGVGSAASSSVASVTISDGGTA